jgi:hypothetical protein
MRAAGSVNNVKDSINTRKATVGLFTKPQIKVIDLATIKEGQLDDLINKNTMGTEEEPPIKPVMTGEMFDSVS